MQIEPQAFLCRAGSILKNKKVGTITKILLTILFVLIVNRSIKPGQIAVLFGRLDPLFLAGALVCGFVSLYLQMLRWEGVLKAQGFLCGKRAALKTLLWGNLLAFITPGRLGEFFRGFELDKSRRSASVIAVIIDRFFGLSATIILGFAAAAFFVLSGRYPPLPFIITLTVSALSVPVVYFLMKSGFVNRSVRSKRVVSSLSLFVNDLIRMKWNSAIFLSIAAHLFLILQTALLFRMFGGQPLFSGSLAASQAYALMIFLPFSIANIGVREYTFGLFLGISLNPIHPDSVSVVALGASTIILAMNIILPAMAGLTWALLIGEHPKEQDKVEPAKIKPEDYL